MNKHNPPSQADISFYSVYGVLYHTHASYFLFALVFPEIFQFLNNSQTRGKLGWKEILNEKKVLYYLKVSTQTNVCYLILYSCELSCEHEVKLSGEDRGSLDFLNANNFILILNAYHTFFNEFDFLFSSFNLRLKWKFSMYTGFFPG